VVDVDGYMLVVSSHENESGHAAIFETAGTIVTPARSPPQKLKAHRSSLTGNAANGMAVADSCRRFRNLRRNAWRRDFL
jgi:hypothetical protein